jgi:hypothetical protein
VGRRKRVLAEVLVGKGPGRHYYECGNGITKQIEKGYVLHCVNSGKYVPIER